MATSSPPTLTSTSEIKGSSFEGLSPWQEEKDYGRSAWGSDLPLLLTLTSVPTFPNHMSHLTVAADRASVKGRMGADGGCISSAGWGKQSRYLHPPPLRFSSSVDLQPFIHPPLRPKPFRDLHYQHVLCKMAFLFSIMTACWMFCVSLGDMKLSSEFPLIFQMQPNFCFV